MGNDGGADDDIVDGAGNDDGADDDGGDSAIDAGGDDDDGVDVADDDAFDVTDDDGCPISLALRMLSFMVVPVGGIKLIVLVAPAGFIAASDRALWLSCRLGFSFRFPSTWGLSLSP